MAISANEKTFRRFLVLYAGQIISMIGSNVIHFAIIWWITVTYNNAIFLSVAYFLAIGVQILLSPIAGVYADRWSRKKIMAVSDTIQAILSIGLVVIFLNEAKFDSIILIGAIIAITTLRAIVGAFQGPAASAIIPAMVPQDKLSRFNGLQFIVNSGVNIVGPALGAVLYSMTSMVNIVLLDGITYFFAIVPLLVIRIPDVRSNGKSDSENIAQTTNSVENSFLAEFKEGLGHLNNINGMVAMLSLAVFLNFFFMPFEVLRPYFIYVIHLGTANDLAIVTVLTQVGMLASGFFIMLKRDWNNVNRTIFGCLYIQFIAFFLFVLSPSGNFLWMGMLGFIWGFCNPIVNALFMTLIQVIIKPEMQGRITGVLRTATGLMTPLSAILAGPLAEIFGIIELLIICAILSFLITTLFLIGTDIREVGPTYDQKVNNVNLEDDTGESLVSGIESIPSEMQSEESTIVTTS